MKKIKNSEKKLALLLFAIITLFYSAFLITSLTPRAFASGSSPSGPNSSSSNTFDMICTPDNSSNTSQYNFARCLNNVYIFAISIGSFVAVLMFVLAGYMYMSGKQEKGKEFIRSTIFGLVILFGSYIFLNTIDPNLTNINVEPLAPINCDANNCTIPTTPQVAANAPDAGTQDNAKALLKLASEGKILLAPGTDCPPNGPLLNLSAIAAGQDAQYDGPGKICDAGTTSIDDNLIKGLIEVANNNLRVSVTSITSGHHASQNDPHYAGEAVDFVPSSKDQIPAILQKLQNNGLLLAAVECNLPGVSQHQFLVLDLTDLNGPKAQKDINTCVGRPDYHIHAQWTASNENG